MDDGLIGTLPVLLVPKLLMNENYVSIDDNDALVETVSVLVACCPLIFLFVLLELEWTFHVVEMAVVSLVVFVFVSVCVTVLLTCQNAVLVE